MSLHRRVPNQVLYNKAKDCFNVNVKQNLNNTIKLLRTETDPSSQHIHTKQNENSIERHNLDLQGLCCSCSPINLSLHTRKLSPRKGVQCDLGWILGPMSSLNPH